MWKQEAVRLRLAGWKQIAIAAQLGKHQSAVARAVNPVTASKQKISRLMYRERQKTLNWNKMKSLI